MKKNLFLLFMPMMSMGQIFYQNDLVNGMGMTITPTGIAITRANSMPSTNLVFGNQALAKNKSGGYNTVIGNNSLFLNDFGSFNTAVGLNSLGSNVEGSKNTAIGFNALFKNSTGHYNTALGEESLGQNTIGSFNTSIGYNSFQKGTSGSNNTVSGAFALSNVVNGSNNTAYGYKSGFTINTIDNQMNNTFIGANADVSTILPQDFPLINSTVIGYNAKVDASNKVRIGDTNITVIEGQVAWSNPSDRRLKENIFYTNRLGLDFVNRLQTISYNYIADGSKTRYDGFIAQDVEKVMKDLNVPFSGLKKSDNGTYSLAYSDFVMPLVNAVQELNAINKNQQAQIDNLTKKNELLSASIEEIKAELIRLRSTVGNDKNTSK